MRGGGGAVNTLAAIPLIVGALLLAFGAWLLLPAAGFIVAGAFAMGVGVLLLDVRGDRS